MGPALAGFSINWIGVHWSMCIVFGFSILSLIALSQISKKPIVNPKIGESIKDSLTEGLTFVFRNQIVLGALSLDMIAVLFGGAVALLPVFAQDIFKSWRRRFWCIESCSGGRFFHYDARFCLCAFV